MNEVARHGYHGKWIHLCMYVYYSSYQHAQNAIPFGSNNIHIQYTIRIQLSVLITIHYIYDELRQLKKSTLCILNVFDGQKLHVSSLKREYSLDEEQ